MMRSRLLWSVIGRRRRMIMRIGFIGLGNMGGPMALNLIKAGHTLTVHDVRRNHHHIPAVQVVGLPLDES